MFKNRKDAGIKLAQQLEKYKDKDTIVLAIPRGGVEVGYEVAKFLNCKFDILIVRKLGFPNNPEAGFGAITEDKTTYLIPYIEQELSQNEIDKVKEQEFKELQRRLKEYRNNKTLPQLKNKTVIIVDDGIAMGVTLKAAILFCRKHKPLNLIVASPVSSEQTKQEICHLVDDIIILETPIYFSSVSQVYQKFEHVTDEDVKKIMAKLEHF